MQTSVKGFSRNRGFKTAYSILLTGSVLPAADSPFGRFRGLALRLRRQTIDFTGLF